MKCFSYFIFLIFSSFPKTFAFLSNFKNSNLHSSEINTPSFQNVGVLRFRKETREGRRGQLTFSQKQRFQHKNALHAVPVESLMKSIANVESILILTAVITSHELGHFLAARLQGIKIENFSIGFGPEIFWVKPQKENGVKYSLRLIPLGGFVSFPQSALDDEMPEKFEERTPVDPNDPDLLENRPALQRIIVISAGVVANLILSFLLIFGSVTTFGISKPHFQPGVTVSQIIDSTGPAKLAGLSAKDTILAIDGEELPADVAALSRAVDTIRGSAGKAMSFTIERDGKTLTKEVVAAQNGAGNSYGIGVMLSTNMDRVDQFKLSNPVEAAFFAVSEVTSQCGLVLANFKRLLLTGDVGNVSGPLGVVETGAEMAQENIGSLLGFAVTISINLAVINSIPIPALDGGQLTFVLLEALLQKKLDKDFVNRVNVFFFLGLMGLSVSAFVRDIERLSSVLLTK